MLLPCRAHCSLSAVPTRRHHLPRTAVCAAGNSPWSTPPGKGSSSSSKRSGQSKDSKQQGGSSKKKKSISSGKDGPKKPKSSSSGQGFGPKAQEAPPPAPTYKITPPLTPQLLDELSPWDSAAAPLWGTFTGHCEGQWLGQYSAYTPWGGDPEPVWADESGAYLTHAFCKVTEERQSLPADATDTTQGEEEEEDGGLGTASSSFNKSTGQQQQQQQQQQAGGDVLDVLVRSTQRSASIGALMGRLLVSAAAAAAATASTSAPADSSSDGPGARSAPAAAGAAADAAEDEDLELIAYNTDGSVVFNGGSYSLGPEVIEVPAADDECLAEYYAALDAAAGAAAHADVAGAGGAGSSVSDDEDWGNDLQEPGSVLPYSIVVVEQALVASGDKRLRLVATLKLRRPPGQELDVEVGRLLLYKEFWYGTTDGSSSSMHLLPSHCFDVPVTQMSRPQPSDMGGTWNVFVLAANPAVEENPDTLQDETVVLYSSREERQHWCVPDITSTAAPSGNSSNGSSGGGSNPSRLADSNGSSVDQQLTEAASGDSSDSGGSFWLPGGAVVTLRMVANSNSKASDGDSTRGQQAHRGLLIGLHMLDGTGSCLFVEREYDAKGRLLEVRQGTAVKGGWSGGRM